MSPIWVGIMIGVPASVLLGAVLLFVFVVWRLGKIRFGPWR